MCDLITLPGINSWSNILPLEVTYTCIEMYCYLKEIESYILSIISDLQEIYKCAYHFRFLRTVGSLVCPKISHL